jgi:hypothetical protein
MRKAHHRSRRYRYFRALAVLSVLALGVLVLPVAPAAAAFGPNLVVNGSFEVPVTLSGVSTPPYGTCGAVVPLDPPGIIAETNEGCWTNSAGPAGSIYVDRTIAKGGKQSAVVTAPALSFACLTQAVAAGNHLAVCLCGVRGETARFDAVSLKQQL